MDARIAGSVGTVAAGGMASSAQGVAETATPEVAPDRPAGLAQRWLATPNALPLLILLVLSVLTHLVGLGHPRSVVFDEVHFGKFATSYCCTHERFFDVHPPHAKLVIAGTAWLLGYQGGMDFEHIGQPFEDISPVPLRLAPALAGTGLPLIFFALLRLLGATPAGAFFGGLLLVFDNALAIQSRVIGLDSIMLAAMFGALACYLAALRTASVVRHALWGLAAGMLLALGAGSKVIGLAMVGLVGLSLLADMLRDRRPENLLAQLRLACWIAAGGLAVYALGWALHFALLTQSGPGDAWGPPSGNLIADTLRTQRQMIDAHRGLTAGHPYGSPWWSWPLMSRPIFYWGGEGGAKIYLIGNPVVWWGGSLFFVVLLANLLLMRITRLRVEQPRPSPRLWLPIVGFLGAYLPMVDITRVMFLYHYLAALLFSLLAVVLWLDHAGWTREGSLVRQRVSYYLAIEAVVVGFVFMAPLTYGLQWGSSLTERVFKLFPT